MLIKSNGIKIPGFYLPPFELREGEIVVLNLFGGAHFYETKMFFKDIFIGKISDQAVTVLQPLTFVKHFREPALRRIFYPITVREYLRTNADPNSYYSKKIFESKWITGKTRVQAFAGNPRKLLSMYATLSRTNKIVFDVAGLDPLGAHDTFRIAKEGIKNGGAAILLDWTDDMKNEADQ